MKEKLRLSKVKLKCWNIHVFGMIDLEMEEGVREMNAFDEVGTCTVVVEEERRRPTRKFWSNLKINMLIQRARVKWLNDGDINNKYIHAVMKKSLRRNHFGSISTSMGILSSVS